MSVAGGLPRAVERAVLHGCDTLQIFTKNASQWKGRPLPASEVGAFRDAVAQAKLHPVVSHASYLINLAATDPTLRQRSLDAMADELDRAEALDLFGVVLHPGCYTSGSEQHGLQLVSMALTTLLESRPSGTTRILIEQTAGQGTALGTTFEQLATILAGTDHHERIGVCLDTCHLLAAGYDIATPTGYAHTFETFERIVGFPHLKVFHVNDSKRPLGSRVDRHAHIGEGHVGVEAFRRLVNDARFADLPMLLETPKETATSRAGVSLDRFDQQNLGLLRSLRAA